ncbi:MAG: hypothetical protein RI575_02495 [Balneolaceae bacterium]|nr:hypothetical protein [Balneolaceae bacterium]
MEIKIQIRYTKVLFRFFTFSLLILSGPFLSYPEEAKSQVNVNGILQNYLAAQTTEDYEFIATRNRLRLQFDKPTDFGGLQTELDLIHRFDRSQEIEFQLKEAYIEWFLQDYDLRIGQQKIIWGRANGTFITDILTPVDLREFLTISAEDIRFGLTSFNAIRYFGENSLQLVFAPFFQRDLLPGADSRWFPAQQISSSLSPIPVTTNDQDSDFKLTDAQVALRYNLLSPNFIDLDLFLMRWTHPTPAYDVSIATNSLPNLFSIDLVESYQNSWMAGLSTTLEIHPRLFFLGEALFVEEKLFTNIPFSGSHEFDLRSTFQDFTELFNLINPNQDFLTRKPWIHSMAGFRTELFQTTIDAQFFVETIFDYEEDIIQEEYYKYATLFATRSFLRNKLQILALSRYNINTEDYWIQVQGQYELNDNLQLSLGTNLFGGEKSNELAGHLSFSQFRENSFIFSKIALYF